MTTPQPLTYSFCVPVAALKALSLFAARKDIRFYLKGICVDLAQSGVPILVATDGHRMCAVDVAAHTTRADLDLVTTVPTSTSTHPDGVPHGAAILDIDGILQALKLATSARARVMRVTLSGALPAADTPAPIRGTPPTPAPVKWSSATLQPIGGATLTVPIVDGSYPDWRRVTMGPAGPQGLVRTPGAMDARAFNMEYLSATVDACVLLGLAPAKAPALPRAFGQYAFQGQAQADWAAALIEDPNEVCRHTAYLPWHTGVTMTLMPMRA